jgi:hypothetical protein
LNSLENCKRSLSARFTRSFKIALRWVSGITDAVEIEQVEGPKAERRRLVAKLHQRPEARQVRFIAGDELAIDYRRSGRDEIDHRLEGSEPLREIRAVPAVEGSFALH